MNDIRLKKKPTDSQILMVETVENFLLIADTLNFKLF